MHSRRTLWLVLLLLAVSVAACSPSASPQPTATMPRPTATATPQTGQVPVGFTEDGLPYRGNPNALVTLVEHSEFQ